MLSRLADFGTELWGPAWPDAVFRKYRGLFRARHDVICGTSRGFNATEKSKRYRRTADTCQLPGYQGGSVGARWRRRGSPGAAKAHRSSPGGRLDLAARRVLLPVAALSIAAGLGLLGYTGYQ